jgi:hypothetical protein
MRSGYNKLFLVRVSVLLILSIVLQVEGGGEVAGVWEFPRSRLRLQTVLGEGNFGKVRSLSPDKIGLKSFVHFQTVLRGQLRQGEGIFTE